MRAPAASGAAIVHSITARGARLAALRTALRLRLIRCPTRTASSSCCSARGRARPPGSDLPDARRAPDTIARARRRTRRPFPVAVPRGGTLEPLQSKRHQIDTAEKPAWRASDRASASATKPSRGARSATRLREALRQIAFKRRSSVQAFVCETPQELDRAYERPPSTSRWCRSSSPGGDEFLWTLGATSRRTGERSASSAVGSSGRRRLVGMCRVGEAVWDDEVVEQGSRCCASSATTGSRRSSSSATRAMARFKLIEVNPRLWQWHGLAAACGVDLTRSRTRDLLGERVAPARSRRERQAVGDHVHAGRAAGVPAAAIRRRRAAATTRAGARPGSRGCSGDPRIPTVERRALGARHARRPRRRLRRRRSLRRARLGAGRRGERPTIR